MNFDSSEDIEIKQNKKKKIIKIVLIFLFVVLIAVCAVYAYYFKNSDNDLIKKEFFEIIQNNELSFFANNELYTHISDKMETDKYYASSNVKLSTTMENNMFSELDLSKFEFNYNFLNNIDEYYGEIISQYATNDLLTVNFIGNDDEFALKSDEIVNKYVGIKKENIQEIVNKLFETDVDLSSAKRLKNFVIDREYINLENIGKNLSQENYTNIIIEDMSASEFSKQENVIITLDSEQVKTTEYTVNITSNEFNNILSGILNQIENDDELLSELVVSNVQNDEVGKMVEYKDNDNIVEISGDENNFNASINIWGENTTNETNTIEETTTTEETEDETSNNQTINAVTTEEQEEQTDIIEETETEAEDQTQPEAETEEQTETESEVETESEIDNTILEEENLRLQGYISVNEEEETEETTETEFIIGENYIDTIENISDFADNINWLYYLFTGAKANITREELIEEFQKIIQNKIDDNASLTIKMYETDGKTVKIIFSIPETGESLDIEIISKGNNEKYLNVAVLTKIDEKSNGYTISIYKKDTDTVVKNKINIDKILNDKINQKININIETVGTKTSKKYTNTASVVFSNSDGEFSIQTENTLNFDETSEIEELNDENCLFMDNLPNEELLLTRDAIKQKIISVLSEKNRNLNIIEINNGNSIVQQIQTENNSEEDTIAKEAAKQALIQTLTDKMNEYVSNGQELKIEDLEGLEIQNYDVSISISSNLAIITVNGYTFKLDSEFHLSDA